MKRGFLNRSDAFTDKARVEAAVPPTANNPSAKNNIAFDQSLANALSSVLMKSAETPKGSGLSPSSSTSPADIVIDQDFVNAFSSALMNAKTVEAAPPGNSGLMDIKPRPVPSRNPASKDIPFEIPTESMYHLRTLDEEKKRMLKMNPKDRPGLSIRVCGTKALGNQSEAIMFCSWMFYSDLLNSFPLDYGWGQQDIVTPLPHPYSISPSPDAGLGMFSTREIAAGETILVERPAVIIPHFIQGIPQSALNDNLEVMLKALPEDRQRRIKELSHCKTVPGQSALYGRVMTNSLKCYFPQAKILPTYAGVFLDISRCNHSCRPNAVWSFDSKTLFMELRSTRNISAGSEITIAYIDVLQPRDKRRELLLSSYAFTCKCAHCTLSADKTAQSDARRRRIDVTLSSAPQIWREMMDDGTGKLWRKMVDGLKRSLTCLEPEGLEEYRGDLERYLASAYAAIGDEANFRKWAESAVLTERFVEKVGHGYLNGEDWKTWLRDPTLIPCWKQRK